MLQKNNINQHFNSYLIRRSVQLIKSLALQRLGVQDVDIRTYIIKLIVPLNVDKNPY